MNFFEKVAAVIITISIVTPCSLLAQEAKRAKQEFKNQGEQEDYWAKKLFAEEYKSQHYRIYSGSIIEINANTFQYGNDTLKAYYQAPELKALFAKGILYPEIVLLNSSKKFSSSTRIQLRPKRQAQPSSLSDLDSTKSHRVVFSIGLSSFSVANLEEVAFLTASPQRRRFRYWLYTRGMMNPSVCFLELTNNSANQNTDLKTFIDGAELAFCAYGWLII